MNRAGKAAILAAAVLVVAARVATSQQNPPPLLNYPRAQLPASAQSPGPGTVKSLTRLITVDVVVTDSHGNPVRGMTQEDFQVLGEHGEPQKIAHFEFIDTSLSLGPAPGALPAGPHIYSNLQTARLKVPPTAILMDALNTSLVRQMQVRRDMILFLKKLPPDTPVAVFLLGHTVHLVQNFTTDPKLLASAVDQAHRAPDLIQQNPQDDPNSASTELQEMSPNAPGNLIQSLQDFESQQYLEFMDQRVSETADAMRAIAKYLGGYSGRKNLVWFSESFPIWIEPTADFGSDPFIGATTYTGKVREAADALTDAQVAVYPVDARALEGPEAYSAANGSIASGALSREDSLRINSQATMDAIAQETGGQTCKNTNDLSGCVQTALNEGSSYYEVSYYPENVKWDGRFEKITVKTPRKGVKLAYRRGYFAASPQMRTIPGQPDQVLKDACIDALPSTAIDMTVEPLAPRETTGQAPEPRYLVTISSNALSFGEAGGARQLNLQMAICEYDAKGDHFDFFPRDLSRPVDDAAVASWQQHGIRDIFDYAAKPENPRLRFAVLDAASGMVGSVDVPAHTRDYGEIPGQPAPVQAVAPAGAAPAPAPQKITTSLTFRSNSGKVDKLDWSGGTVTYGGDLGVGAGASAFFQNFFAAAYHCENGNLVSNDPKSAGVAPKLALSLQSPNGLTALIDLTGTEPQYEGNLPVDRDAKAFFNEVWKLCHCQAP